MYKALIMDDNKPLADSLAKLQLWRQMNCEVVRVCYDSVSGKEAILQEKPDIIITDIRMPGLSGLDVIDTIRQKLPLCKVIFMSAYDDFRYAQRALRMGAQDYLLKPFSKENLAESVSRTVKALDQQRVPADVEELTDMPVVKPIIRYIQAHLADQTTAYDVAKEFYMSISRLNNLLQKATGSSYRELRMELRMKQAQKLLMDPRYSIEEIGMMVGYKNYVSFYRAFCREYAMPPTEYRDRSQSQSKEERSET